MYFVDPHSSWWYWEKWPCPQPTRTRPRDDVQDSQGWAPDASQWPKVSKRAQQPAPEPGSARPKVVACRPSDWQARTPPVLATFGQLKEALGKGEPPPGNLVVVYTKEDLAQLHDLWQAFGDPSGLTAVAVDKAAGGEGLTQARVSLTRDRCGSRLEAVGLEKVSALHSGPWVQQATKVEIASVPVASKVTVRVTAAWQYRAQFLDKAALEDSPTLVIQSLARAAGVKVSDLLGGNWQSHDRGQSTSVVGHLRLREEVAERVLLVSGEQGLFLSLVGASNRVEPFWIRTLPGEARESYYLRVLSLKRQRTQPVLFRPGGGHDLGFPRLPQDHDDRWARHFTATGIPRAWDSTDVAHFFRSQNWSQLEQVSKRRNCWFFKALAPEGAQTSWRYIPEGDEAWCINVCLSTGQRKQAQVTPLGRPKPKLSESGQDAAPSELHRTPAQDSKTMDLDAETEAVDGDSGTVQPTQLDSDAGTGERRGPRSRSPVRPRGVASPHPTLKQLSRFEKLSKAVHMFANMSNTFRAEHGSPGHSLGFAKSLARILLVGQTLGHRPKQAVAVAS